MKFRKNQLVELLVDIRENDLCIEKGTMCRVIEVDGHVDYILVHASNNLYAWVSSNNLKTNNVKVFMGGTCQGFNWRSVLENRFKEDENVELFNPVVDNYTNEYVNIENEYKEDCDICLFVITPYMEGCYSIAEAVDMSNKHPEKLLFVYIDHYVENKEIRDFTAKMKHSLEVTGRMIKKNGGKVYTSLDDVVEFINNFRN